MNGHGTPWLAELLPRFGHLRNEPVSPPRYGFNVDLGVLALAEGAPESGDLLVKIVLLDDAVGPDGLHEFLSGYNSLPVA